jgi:hypothetical protein
MTVVLGRRTHNDDREKTCLVSNPHRGGATTLPQAGVGKKMSLLFFAAALRSGLVSLDATGAGMHAKRVDNVN